MNGLFPQRLIATASAFVGLGEHVTDHVAGGLIDRLRHNGASGDDPVPRALDVAVIQHWGFWSQYDHSREQSLWPLASVRTAAELGALAAERGILRKEPEVGDIFLQYSPKRASFVHAGVVARVGGSGTIAVSRTYVDIHTIEGDANERGQLGGGNTVRLARRLWPSGGDRFVRWVELDASAACRVVRDDVAACSGWP